MRILCLDNEVIASKLRKLNMAGIEISETPDADYILGCDRLVVIGSVAPVGEGPVAPNTPKYEAVREIIQSAQIINADIPEVTVLGVVKNADGVVQRIADRIQTLAAAPRTKAREFAVCRMDACYCCLGPNECTTVHDE